MLGFGWRWGRGPNSIRFRWWCWWSCCNWSWWFHWDCWAVSAIVNIFALLFALLSWFASALCHWSVDTGFLVGNPFAHCVGRCDAIGGGRWWVVRWWRGWWRLRLLLLLGFIILRGRRVITALRSNWSRRFSEDWSPRASI